MFKTFPPPNFIITESAVTGIEVYQPAPEDEIQERPVVEFKCPQCMAATAYSATDGGLTCTHCGYYEPPSQEVVGKGAESFDFSAKNLKRAAHGWGTNRKELQCQNCGAYTSVPPDSLTHTCPFCNSNNVIQREAPHDLLRPRFVVPFKIEADLCIEPVLEWLVSSWMTPGKLNEMASVDSFTGIYLPFWTFDSTTQASWRAEVGHTKTESYYSNGKRKTRTKTVWKWESGKVKLNHDDLLVPGTNRLSKLLLNRLRDGFDTNALALYEPQYLAGYQAQAYDIQLEEAWETGRHEMREATRQGCRDQASTSQIRNFSMNLKFKDENWRYILLPIYIATYSYGDQNYQVMVNGQSGLVSGQRPVAWWKIWLASTGMVTPGILLCLLGIATLIFGGVGLPIGVFGFVALVFGLIGVAWLVGQADALDDI
ncbi:hypothetical protein QUF58_12985 [Anaerolineales bacterium HSG24]|nr:hypothetical protein [Anaerolineales bacterium HSG24]